MTNEPVKSGASAVAKSMEAIKVDPGVGAFKYENLGDYVKFADVMCRSAEMLPEHLRMKPALCLAVLMRATHWGFDPYALANETYQAKPGGVIGYQAKVFIAALRTCAGVQLKYDFDGKIDVSMKPFMSANNRKIADRTATGDRKVTAWALIDGERLEYETPILDEIGVKNSPLWHNDPDQQLRYYAARGWARIHRPDVMMGVFEADEVREMDRAVKDVTPKENAFAKLGKDAREAAAEVIDDADEESAETDHDPITGEIVDDDDATEEFDQESPHFKAGMEAAASGFTRSQCPKDLNGPATVHWFAGWDTFMESQPEEVEA